MDDIEHKIYQVLIAASVKEKVMTPSAKMKRTERYYTAAIPISWYTKVYQAFGASTELEAL